MFVLLFSVALWLMVNQGLPWENNRIWMSGNPDNQAEIGTKPSLIMSTPVLGDILLFFVNGQFLRNDWGADQYRKAFRKSASAFSDAQTVFISRKMDHLYFIFSLGRCFLAKGKCEIIS